jgi:hypothetical protein
VVHAAGATPGAATHVSTAEVSLAAARTDLRLVFARVGDQPALGTAIAGASAKPELEILALPSTAAAEVATKGAGAVPAAVVQAGRVAATKILADANEASLSTVTAAATPTDNVLSRALQGVWNFGLWTGSSSVPPLPAGFDTKTYTSILKVLSNLVNVGLLPFTVVNQALQGQWSAIPTNITNTLNTFSTSLGRLPGSIGQTLHWIVTGTATTATAVKPTTLAAGATTAVAGATTADAVTGKGAKNPTETGTDTKGTTGTGTTGTGTGTGTDGAGTGTTGGTDTGGTKTGDAGGTKDSSGTESGSTGGSTSGSQGDSKTDDSKTGDTKTGDTKTGDTKSGDAAADTTKSSTTGKHSAGSGTYGRHARQDDGNDSTASASSGTSTTSATGGRHRKPEGSSSTGSTGSSSSSTGGEHSSAA